MSQKLEDYEVLGVIGSGSSSTCYKIRHKFSEELFVWKAIDYGNLTKDEKQLLVSEVNLLKTLSHPNIVKYCGKILHKETTTLYIITEWCEGGDLCGVIKDAKECGKYINEQFIWRMLYQIGRALQVCHSRMREFTIFHRDVKPANVFLDRHGNAKLGDFGLARIVSHQNDFTGNIVGTPYYMSPEIIKGAKYNRKSDVWALGCLIYELCALKPPFVGSTLLELTTSIKSGRYKNIPIHYSSNMEKLISFMLSTKHEFRPTVEMILHHPSVVINIKSEQEVGEKGTHPLKSDYNQESDIVNRTLVEPQLISNKVFKEKWVEKQEALKEKEALLKQREKSLSHKEKSLASREKHLQVMEERARVRRRLNSENPHCFKVKEKGNRIGAHSGNETDFSVEPADTPIRPTSSKLNPLRFPKPEILTNACKKLGSLSINNVTHPDNITMKPIEKNLIKSKLSNSECRIRILEPNVNRNQATVKLRKDYLCSYNKTSVTELHSIIEDPLKCNGKMNNFNTSKNDKKMKKLDVAAINKLAVVKKLFVSNVDNKNISRIEKSHECKLETLVSNKENIGIFI